MVNKRIEHSFPASKPKFIILVQKIVDLLGYAMKVQIYWKPQLSQLHQIAM